DAPHYNTCTDVDVPRATAREEPSCPHRQLAINRRRSSVMRPFIACRPRVSIAALLLSSALLAPAPSRAQGGPPAPPPPVDRAILQWMEQRIAAEVEARMAEAEKKRAAQEKKPEEKPAETEAPKASEPFAFGDFTWLNGANRQKSALLDTKYFTGS